MTLSVGNNSVFGEWTVIYYFEINHLRIFETIAINPNSDFFIDSSGQMSTTNEKIADVEFNDAQQQSERVDFAKSWISVALATIFGFRAGVRRPAWLLHAKYTEKLLFPNSLVNWETDSKIGASRAEAKRTSEILAMLDFAKWRRLFWFSTDK